MIRICQRAKLKPDKIEEYKKLHARVWPEVLKTITDCNLQNYSIFIDNDEVFSYFEYIGNDYESDMAKMGQDPVTIEWWKHTKPCFKNHEQGIYYQDMESIFPQNNY